jgi:hypothetical protein
MLRRIVLSLVAAALLAAILAQSAGAATLVGDYQFQDVYSSSVAGLPEIGNVGNGNKFVTETVGCSPTRVLSFPKDSGLQLQTAQAGGASSNFYSVVVLFRLAETSGYRRIIAPSNPDSSFSTENGLYQRDGRLAIYDSTKLGNPFLGPTVVFANDVYVEVAFSYAATGTPGDETAGYVNRVLQASYSNYPSSGGLNATWMRFFKDNDSSGATDEESAGAVARIRIYSGDLTAGEVATIHDASPIAGACDPSKRASAAVNGKVKVKRGRHGRFVVLTGIDAGCPDIGQTCTGTAAVDKAGASKRLAVASRTPKHLGKKALSVAAGKTQTVKVKLTKKASDALRAKGKLKAKISVRLETPGGTPAVASRTAKLKPPKPKHH